VPFLRLTRDRRGFENTFLLHVARPGDRPRLLYWYRTAPGIVLGRAPLDEDAIRTIEEQHPDIDFDWPAILALSEVMTPEEEAPAPRRERRGKPPRPQERGRERQPRRDADQAESEEPVEAVESVEPVEPGEPAAGHPFPENAEPDVVEEEAPPLSTYGLLEELVGREIATRLRARYSEIGARIHEQYADASVRDAWMKRAEPLNPELWLTPEAVLEGVRRADALFDRLRTELLSHSSRE